MDANRCLLVGIRGSNSMAQLETVKEAGVAIITADQLAEEGVPQTLRRVREVVREPLYVSVDMDCLDPAYAPAVAVPEVGGLTSREMLQLIRGLRGLPVAGFDVMEVAPNYDQGEITAILAANLVYEFLLTRCP